MPNPKEPRMQLEQGFTLVAPAELVWAAFHNIKFLVDCLPGASIDRHAEPGPDLQTVPLLFRVKLGPMAAGFAGQGRLELAESSRTGTFSGQAVDARTNSRIRGEARFAVVDASATDESTRVDMTVEYTLAGPLAQFGREGVVRSLAEQLSSQFAVNLQGRLPRLSASTCEPPLPVPDRSGPTAVKEWRLLQGWLPGRWRHGRTH
jgi:carbon monoxide dehydrogenase subunit G